MAGNGWEEWGKHVLLELEQNDKAHEKMTEQLQQIQVDIAKLKVKSGFWGALGGAVIALPMILVTWFNAVMRQ